MMYTRLGDKRFTKCKSDVCARASPYEKYRAFDLARCESTLGMVSYCAAQPPYLVQITDARWRDERKRGEREREIVGD